MNRLQIPKSLNVIRSPGITSRISNEVTHQLAENALQVAFEKGPPYNETCVDIPHLNLSRRLTYLFEPDQLEPKDAQPFTVYAYVEWERNQDVPSTIYIMLEDEEEGFINWKCPRDTN